MPLVSRLALRPVIAALTLLPDRHRLQVRMVLSAGPCLQRRRRRGPDAHTRCPSRTGDPTHE